MAADAAMLEVQYAKARTFLADVTEPWDDAAYSGHTWLWLTPSELEAFGAELDELLLRWRRREAPDDGTEDRLPVLAFARAFPAEP